MSNPYSVDHLWPREVLEAYVDMPKDLEGKNLGFTETNRSQWQAWAKRTPRHLWNPSMVQAYKELDRVKAKR